MTLPESFVRRMKTWLGAGEWAPFQDAIVEAPPVRGVRLQRMTVEPDPQLQELPNPRLASYALQSPLVTVPTSIRDALTAPVPWSADSFYIARGSNLGKSIYHEMGGFYLQEPSAMAVVTALNPQPGERILDLCAAPGGKTTAIGKHMRARGILVANEIHPSRVVALAQNVERMGVPAIVTNESPQRLAQALPNYFDAVLVDAPCSGEGMFRKDPGARAEWGPDSPERCAERQKEVFTEAVRLTKAGGRIVYSTCTFNPVENERLVQWALERFPLDLMSLPNWDGWNTGRPDWANGNPALTCTRRLWPHMAAGEGHFIASFRVREDAFKRTTDSTDTRAASLANWETWLESLVVFPIPPEWARPVVQGNLVFARDAVHITARKLRVLRPGLCLALQQKGRFEPHHSFAMAVAPRRMIHAIDVDQGDAVRYLKGQALPETQVRGFVWLHMNNLPLGWGKSVTGRINNLYPKGLRKVEFIET